VFQQALCFKINDLPCGQVTNSAVWVTNSAVDGDKFGGLGDKFGGLGDIKNMI
jgi:hypothetical protein